MSRLSEELIQVQERGDAAVLVTVIEAGGKGGVEPGDKCLVRDGRINSGTIRHKELLQAILQEAEIRLREEKSKSVALELPAAGGKIEVFFEVMPAPPKIIVVGAGHIAVPLVKLAKILNFRVAVMDDRILFANRERFPEADEILVGDMAVALKGLPMNSSTYVVLITRGHKYDELCLREIIHSPVKYIGMIGSRRRIKACFERFKEEENLSEEVLREVYAPIGLDINTETPEEIALSILAEIVKVRRGGKAQSLSGK